MTDLRPEQFTEQFTEAFSRTAFRLELLDHYVAPNEIDPFRVFLSNEMPDPAWREPWKRFVRAARAAGKRMARVHVVTEPLSAYLQFELVCVYPANVEAGEDVRILPRRVADTLALPQQDYWLLDGRKAGVMTYDDEGKWLSVHIIDDPHRIAVYQRAKDIAWRHALPLAAYVEKIKSEGQGAA